MERLQLYISKSLRGFKNLTNINGTEAIRRHLRDLRPALETVAYDSAEKCVFYMIQYVEGASFFTILRTIPDKPLDHLAATIALPDGIQPTADELYGIIREVTRKVSNPGMNADDIAQLRAIFAKEYPVASDSAIQLPSEGRTFAARYFGEDSGMTLRDFLGENLYQPMFATYAGVILVDAGLPFRITGQDISGIPLAKVVTLLPPKRRQDFVPHLFRRVFDRPFKVALGSEVEVVWRRPGFEEVIQKMTVDSDGMRPDPVPTVDSRKAISPASFYVTSRSSNEQLPHVTIRVNGVEITGRHPFTQSELENAEVTITSPGFHPYSGKLDLASTTQALIELAERSGAKAPQSAAAEDKAPTHSAATRAISSTHYGHRRDSGKKWWTKLLLMLAGILIALALCMLLLPDLFGDRSKEPVIPERSTDSVPQASIAAMKMQADSGIDSSLENTPDEAMSAPEPAVRETPAEAKDVAAAVAYLDGNASKGWWSKDELEKFDGLKGLYDDLNNYNFDALMNTWPKKLPGCEWIQTIARHVGEAKAKKLDPKSGRHAPAYTSAGRIHRREYINWINRRQD